MCDTTKNEKPGEPSQKIEAWKLYDNFIRLALKRGTFDELSEIDIVRSILPKLKSGEIDDEVKKVSLALFNKMLSGGALRNVDEAAAAINLHNALTKYDNTTATLKSENIVIDNVD